MMLHLKRILVTKIKAFFIVVCLLAMATVGLAVSEEAASLRDFLYGTTELTSYDNYYSRTVEGLAIEGYNQYAPWDRQTNGFGTFRTATTNQLARWGDVVSSFLSLDLNMAEQLIETHSFPYEIVVFTDTDTDRKIYMLREKLDYDFFDDNGMPDNPELHQHGSFNHGWGIYMFNPASDKPIIITTPHIRDDFITIPISTHAFQLWDARYLMISGAGREAKWTNQGNYTNAKSLSDPTRAEAHPFNVAYQKACDEIRSTFGRREFSAQIHSFDHTHMGYNCLQISAGGSAHNYPGLPIRDVSGNFLDIVNMSPYVLFPEGTIGRNEEVLVTDYYSVFYSAHGHRYNNDGEPLTISNNINLPGYANSRQVAYTTSGWNKYDVFSPFYHIEMEELPSCFAQNQETYWWFYGYDAENECWDTDNFYTNAINFYTPWLEHMNEILPTVFELDDEVPPTNPTHLRIEEVAFQQVGLSWRRSYSYDFQTYEILYATEPINLETPNYNIVNRNRVSTLAGQAYTSANVTNLQPGLRYYLRIRAKDYNGEYSEVSNEVQVHTVPASVSYLSAYGRDGYVDVEWYVLSQRNIHGYKLWRYDVSQEFYEMIGNYEADSLLVGMNGEDIKYSFRDDTAQNGMLYEYRITAVAYSGEEHNYQLVGRACAEPIYSLLFRNQDNTVVDSIEFGVNLYTMDGIDPLFDLFKAEPPDEETEEDYVYATFYYPQEWVPPTQFLQRDINGNFNTEETYKIWKFRVYANLFDEPLTVSISDNYTRFGEKLYLRSNATMEMYDLTEEPVEFVIQEDEHSYWALIWGNLLPEIKIATLEKRYYQAGEEIRFEWDSDYVGLIESIDLYLQSEVDSIAIASGLERDTTYFDWVFPDSTTVSGVNFVVQTNMGNDQYLCFKSSSQIGILPSSYNFFSNAGWHLKANPFLEPLADLEGIFGEGVKAYPLGINTPESKDSLEFGKGYWVYHSEDVQYNVSGKVHRTRYEMPLQYGWNLVPNVLLHTVQLHDLMIKERNQRSWGEAVRRGDVEGAAFAYRDNCYVLTDSLNVGEAGWIFSNKSGLALCFELFNKGEIPQKQEIEWSIAINAKHQGDISDEVIIGAPAVFKTRKPPNKPGEKVVFYLINNENESLKLHRLFAENLSEGYGERREWPFVLEIDNLLEPLYFSMRQETVPEEYQVLLSFEDTQIILSEIDEYLFFPAQNTTEGLIIVEYQDPTSVEDYPEVPVLFANYPNPFFAVKQGERSGGTNISFWLNNQSKVKLDVFNIRGQFVTTLLNDEIDRGRYEIFWGGQSSKGTIVSSGIYFYSLKVDGKVVAKKKMMLLK